MCEKNAAFCWMWYFVMTEVREEKNIWIITKINGEMKKKSREKYVFWIKKKFACGMKNTSKMGVTSFEMCVHCLCRWILLQIQHSNESHAFKCICLCGWRIEPANISSDIICHAFALIRSTRLSILFSIVAFYYNQKWYGLSHFHDVTRAWT